MATVIEMHPLKLLPLSLEHLSLIKIATHLWKDRSIRDNIKMCLQINRHKYDCSPSEVQRFIFTSVLEKIDQLVFLPMAQKSDLKFVATQVGLSAFEWLENSMDINKVDMVDNLQWDSVGSIDAAETYRSLYYSGKIKRYTTKRLKAIHQYCLSDCISDYWHRVPRHERGPQLRELYPGTFESGAALYWSQYVHGLSTVAPDQQTAEAEGGTLVVWSRIVKNPYQSFKYFWNRSTDMQKDLVIKKVQYLQYSKLKFEGLVVATNSLNCLLECMDPAQREEFQETNSEILEKIYVDIFLHWPWHNLLVAAIRTCLNPLLYLYAWDGINKQAYVEYQIFGHTQKYHHLTKELWQTTPTSMKLAVSRCYDFVYCMYQILGVNDIELIRVIFDDKDLAEVRQEILHEFAKYWSVRMRNSWQPVFPTDSETFVNFVQHVLHSDEERGLFTMRFN